MYCRLHHSGVCPRQVFPLQRHSWVVWAGSLLSAWGNISKWKSARLGIIVITLHSSHFSHQMRRTRGYSQRDPGEKMSNIRLQVGGIIPSEQWGDNIILPGFPTLASPASLSLVGSTATVRLTGPGAPRSCRTVPVRTSALLSQLLSHQP